MLVSLMNDNVLSLVNHTHGSFLIYFEVWIISAAYR